jgi:hypothetical protein
MEKAMNMLKKWLSQPVVITFYAGLFSQIRGRLVEVDEQWLTVDQPAEGIVVVSATKVVRITLDAK